MVAEGCVFTDGSVALRWRGSNPATAVWPDLDSVLAVHGHEGATEVRWIDADHGAGGPEPRIPATAAFDQHTQQAYREDPPLGDLDELFTVRHAVRPPASLDDPSGRPGHHTGGWAGARHLR